MKRLFAVLMALLLLAGCTGPVPEPAATPTPAAPVPTPVPAQTIAPLPTLQPTPEPVDVDALQHCEHEYGEPESITGYDGAFTYIVLYPQCEVNRADRAIKQWAEELVESTRNEIDQLRAEHGDAVEGELNVHYDSYLAADYIVGVVERGMYSHSMLAHPADIVKTFNIDLHANKVLSAKDVFPAKGRAHILALLSEGLFQLDPDLADATATLDESWLETFVLTEQGVDFLFPRGEFLPSALGTLSVTLSYADLGDSFHLPKFSALVGAEASPTPTIYIPYEDELPGAAATPDAAATPSAAPSPQPSQEPEEPLPTAPPKASVDASRPMIALTFDDGPSVTTPKILKLLDQYGGRATFCMVGNRVKSKADIVRQVVAQGSEIANHTWEHKKLTSLSTEEIKKQIEHTNAMIESVAGVTPHFLRPPYGSVNDSVKAVTRELGMPIVNWSIDTEDWKTRNANSTYKAIMKDVKDGAIILCHDLHAETGDAMERVIPDLVAQGYQLVTVSELLANASPGSLYRHR